jgi:beta-glucosidase
MDAQGITPRYEFGYGLSYTTFSYSSLSISTTSSSSSSTTSSSPLAYTISFTVTNSGHVNGTEIPQLYLGFPSGSGEPKMVLRGFDEVQDLGVGESKTVTLGLTQREIRLVFLPFYSYMVLTFPIVSGTSYSSNGCGLLGRSRCM